MDLFTTLALTSFREQLTLTNQESPDEHKNEWMKIDIDSMNNLLQLLDEFDGDSQFLIRFVALILVPKKWLRKLSDSSEPFDNINIIKVLLLKDLSRNRRVELASIVISLNNLKQEDLLKLFFNNWKLNSHAIIGQLKDYVQDKDSKEGNRESSIVYVLQILENVLHNELFLKSMAASDAGEDLYSAITEFWLKTPNWLPVGVQKLTINIIAKLTIGFKDKEDLLAKKTVQDLEQLKVCPDTDFVNNILAPLLKAEHKVPVSLVLEIQLIIHLSIQICFWKMAWIKEEYKFLLKAWTNSSSKSLVKDIGLHFKWK